MATMLHWATAAALTLGLLGSLLPGAPGRGMAWASFGLVVAAPAVRVGWLACRWVLRRDLAFAGLAFALLSVVGVGGLLAVLVSG